MLVKHRIYISLLLLSLLPLGLISILSIDLAEDALDQVIVRDFQNLAREKGEAIGRVFDANINEVRLIASHPTIVAAVKQANDRYQGRDEKAVMDEIERLDRAWISNKAKTEKAAEIRGNQLSGFLSDLQHRRPQVYGEMFVTDKLGATVAMTKNLSDYYQADEYWWGEGATHVHSGAFLDDRGYDESVGSIVIGVVVPVLDEGKVIGVFKINFRVKTILDIVSGEGLDPGYVLLLARSDGTVISSSDESHPDVLHPSELEMITTGKKGSWQSEFHGAKSLAAYYPMKHTFSTRDIKGAVIGVAGEKTRIKTWYVLYELDHDIAFAAVQELRDMALSLGTGSIALAILLGSLLSRAIFKPLKILKQGTEIIGGGKLDHRIPLKKKDEFGSLAYSFNGMSERLLQTLASRDELNREIDERKAAEQNLERLHSFLQDVINSMPSMLVAVDEEYHVTQWNEETSRITGVAASQVMGKTLEHALALPPELMSRVLTAVKADTDQKLLRQKCELLGNKYFMDIMIYPLSGTARAGSVIRLDDVTERVRIESMMSQTEKMTSIGGLAAGMSHELNNPLGGILQALQNMRRRFSADLQANQEVAQRLQLDLEKVHAYMEERQIGQFMQAIEESGSRAADIVHNLVKFIRQPDAGKHAEDASELIERTLELAALDYDMKKKYGFRDLAIVREYDPGLMSVSCQAPDIQQVILNGLRNAAQALSEQEPKNENGQITVRTCKHAGMARIEVEDNGPGMDEETRQRVFEPFFTTHDPGEGTGLGLSVSYYIVHDQHGGELNIESTLGKGTKLIIELPLKNGS